MPCLAARGNWRLSIALAPPKLRRTRESDAMNEVTVAFDAGNHLGETPIWSVEDQALWWVNCEEPPEIHRWSPATGEHAKWQFPDRVGGFVHKAGGCPG